MNFTIGTGCPLFDLPGGKFFGATGQRLTLREEPKMTLTTEQIEVLIADLVECAVTEVLDLVPPAAPPHERLKANTDALDAAKQRLRDEFERLRRAEVTDAVRDVLAERARQVSAEGWTSEHDDAHDRGEMAGAGACYALASTTQHWAVGQAIKTFWPWAAEWWKPKSPRENLVRSAALILAEIERIDRSAAMQHRGETE